MFGHSIPRRMISDNFAGALQRLMLLTGLYRYTLLDVRTSDSVKRVAAAAKQEKVKKFYDIRVDIIGIERSIQVMLNNIHMVVKDKGHLQTFTDMKGEMTSERYKDIDEVFMDLVQMPEDKFQEVISFINQQKQSL